MLKVEGVTLQFGEMNILDDINITVQKGALHAIIGPNGAGKTSLINVLSGVYKPTKGKISLDNNEITHKKPYEIANMGIARVFQNIELFDKLTVLDNIMLGRHLQLNYGMFSAGIYFGKARREELLHRKKCEDIIDFLEIEEIRKQPVGILPYGLRKKVELARALAMEPKVLLLDEPVAGMNNEEKDDMVRYILELHQETDITIILIEHDMQIVMDISDKVTVLNFGRVIAEGTPLEVQNNQLVIDAYLGHKHEHGEGGARGTEQGVVNK